MFEFDAIDQWGPSLARYLGEVVPTKAYEFLRDRKPKYFEEYRDVLFRAPDVRPGKVITATGDWLSSQPVIAYHGSRLTPAEIENVILKGLEPLHARRRIDRLRLIFSQHPNWFDISSRLSEVIDEFGAHGLAKGHGLREGFVHAAISRDSLINCFDRYLTYGFRVRSDDCAYVGWQKRFASFGESWTGGFVSAAHSAGRCHQGCKSVPGGWRKNTAPNRRHSL